MPRPRLPIEYFISKTINEYFENIQINEILDEKIPTKYEQQIV